MEIPGQYAHSVAGWDAEPDPSAHDLLVSVDQQVLVMESIRRPKRVKFYGSSGREYVFLVKGGEDLRNDERVGVVFWCFRVVGVVDESKYRPNNKIRFVLRLTS